MDVLDNDNADIRRTQPAWTRPHVEQRADQLRESAEVAVTALRYPALRALTVAWHGATVSERQSPPSRDAFHPTDVPKVLARMTILERIPADSERGHTWRYRLVGTEIATIVQFDMTGDTIDRFHRPLAGMLHCQYDRALAADGPVAFHVRTVVDNRSYAYEKLVLPTRSEARGPVDQLVVATYPLDGS